MFNSFSNSDNIEEIGRNTSEHMFIKGACNVSMNMVILSFSYSGGSTWVANSLHLYALKVSELFFVIFYSCILSGTMSILYLYCFKKASTKSFHDEIRVGSRCIYQFNATPPNYPESNESEVFHCSRELPSSYNT